MNERERERSRYVTICCVKFPCTEIKLIWDATHVALVPVLGSGQANLFQSAMG